MVVLTIYCQQKGWSIAECFQLAYNEIKNRKGKMVNGSFVKSEDLR
nr:MAG TPA: dCTP pyrophosphatase 1 [Caudoviricetes sp.]